jgi:hypothetical protein
MGRLIPGSGSPALRMRAHTKAQRVYRVGYDLGQLTGKLGPLLRHDVSLLQKQLYVFALGELLAGCY